MLNQLDLELHESDWLQRNDLQNRDLLITCIRLADISSPPPLLLPTGSAVAEPFRGFSTGYFWEISMPRWSNVVVTGYSPYMEPRIQILPHTARQLQNMLKATLRNFLLKFPNQLFHFVKCNITTKKLPNVFQSN